VTRRGGEDDELWAAVADPTRRRLLDVLLTRGDATATTLADDLPVTRQAVAKHLAVLDRTGLVVGERRGREVRYAVRPERLDAATQAMARVAADWDARLVAIKRLAEAVQRERSKPAALSPTGGSRQSKSAISLAARAAPSVSTGR
jgi:ArsR family transcriptional regulator, cadmium/lead-responsive transcriptional repressor